LVVWGVIWRKSGSLGSKIYLTHILKCTECSNQLNRPVHLVSKPLLKNANPPNLYFLLTSRAIHGVLKLGFLSAQLTHRTWLPSCSPTLLLSPLPYFLENRESLPFYLYIGKPNWIGNLIFLFFSSSFGNSINTFKFIYFKSMSIVWIVYCYYAFVLWVLQLLLWKCEEPENVWRYF
jgi:hypothetical protein